MEEKDLFNVLNLPSDILRSTPLNILISCYL